MKKVHWLYAYTASLALHAVLVAAFLMSSAAEDGAPPPGAAVMVVGSLAGVLGSDTASDDLNAPVEVELSDPSDVLAPETVEAVEPVEVKAAAAEAEVATLASQVIAATDTAELQVAAANEASEIDDAPVLEARPKPEKDVTAREEPKAPEKKRKPKEAREDSKKDGRDKKVSHASKIGTNFEGNAGAKSGGGGNGASSGANASELSAYAARVRAKILSHRPRAGTGGGSAVVSFGLTASGGLSYARLKRSSGNPSLDQAALAAVRSAAPFPSPPQGARTSQLRFAVPLHFR